MLGAFRRFSTVAFVNDRLVILLLRSRRIQCGVYSRSAGLLIKLVFRISPNGPKGTCMFAKGPVVTQPPPVPGERVTLTRGMVGMETMLVMSDRLGMNSPLPDKLYGEPSKSGEASTSCPSIVQSQYLRHTLADGNESSTLNESNGSRLKASVPALPSQCLIICPQKPTMPWQEQSLVFDQPITLQQMAHFEREMQLTSKWTVNVWLICWI